MTAIGFTTVRFVDTNILLYAISTARSERRKSAIANRLLTARDLALSVQVLQEFFVQATRQARPDRLTHEQAAALVNAFLRFRIAELTTPLMLAAMSARRRFGISYWDAAIIEAARSIDCDVVLSDDLADGEEYDGVRVENPFRA